MVSFEKSNIFFNPNVKGVNPFAAPAFKGTAEPASSETAEYSERLGNGKAAGVTSNGVYGEVPGCGENGAFCLKGFNGGAMYA